MPSDFNEDRLRHQVSLVVSPVAELFNSLHVLSDPAHHLSNRAWADTTLTAMTPTLRSGVIWFGQRFNQWLDAGDLLHVVHDAGLSISAFLDTVAQLPVDQVVAITVGDVAQAHMQIFREELDPEVVAARTAARRDPVAFVARLTALLSGYWNEVFAAEWERRRPLLEQRHAQEAARLDGMPAVDWLAGLHGRIEYDPGTRELVFHKHHDLRFAIDDLERILCVPSTFTAPHLMVGFVGSELMIAINVGLPVATIEPVPAELLRVVKALGDQTRLLIFKAVLKRPHYTQELAAALQLAEPTVSRHLKVLKGAGLVRSRKDGAVVLYSGVLEPVDRLPAVLQEFIRG